jgi:hypothetical protein
VLDADGWFAEWQEIQMVPINSTLPVLFIINLDVASGRMSDGTLERRPTVDNELKDKCIRAATSRQRRFLRPQQIRVLAGNFGVKKDTSIPLSRSQWEYAHRAEQEDWFCLMPGPQARLCPAQQEEVVPQHLQWQEHLCQQLD